MTKFVPSGKKLVFSTFIGGERYDYISALALDDDGAIYICSSATSGKFPLKKAFDNSLGGEQDVFVAKLK